MVPPLMQ
jgi:hypothetical protein